MASDSLNRRRVLKGMTVVGGAGLTGSLAGCLGGQEPEPTDTPTDTEPGDGGTDGDGDASVTVTVTSHPTYGDVLADADGMTLYLLGPDDQGPSVCYDQCAEAWPPLTVESEDQVAAGGGVSASLGTVERDDGSLQVTADGWPLYYWFRDETPGDATGMGVNNVWFLLRPDGSVLRPTVSTIEHDALGNTLTDDAGNVLYMFEPDDMGESQCYGDCADAWPPLTVDSEQELLPAATVTGDLGTVERDDGSLQVTAGGWPLYYFAVDEEPGDARGQEAGNVWFVLRPDGSVLRPTVSVREVDEYGEILTDALGQTLYMFEPDDMGESQCYGDCADAWPPLTVESDDEIVESVKTDVALGTVERDDGALQVTAADWPLYYFVQDEAPGDIAGQGINDVWYVLGADGSVLREPPSSDNSAGGPDY